MKFRAGFAVLALFAFLGVQGCSHYTTKNALPENIKSIYVKTVTNKIKVEEIISYKPGLEMDITNAIVRRLQRDGNLKVAGSPEEADVILDAQLIHFDQEGLRFSKLETTQESRLYIVLSLKLLDAKSKQPLWEEASFSGDQEYFLSTIHDQSRDTASDLAIDRLARNVVDRIVEDW